MDREKLKKKAEEQANYSTHWSWGDRKDCFISGADWLMQQPLSERLTDEEKEKIRGYLTSAMFVYASGSHASLEGLRDMFIDIFGSDLLIPNQPTAV